MVQTIHALNPSAQAESSPVIILKTLFPSTHFLHLPTPKVRGLYFSIGIRGEGIPVRDLIGKSTDFRRPGVALSLDPGFIYTRGKDQWAVNVPFAMYRNRQASVPDITEGRHGDAAFADQFLVVSYARRF